MDALKQTRTKDRNYLKQDDYGAVVNTNCGFRTKDATSTPVTSPVTVNATTWTELKTPADANEIFAEADDKFLVSRNGIDADGHVATTQFYEGVSKQESVFLKGKDGNVDVSFRYGVTNPMED